MMTTKDAPCLDRHFDMIEALVWPRLDMVLKLNAERYVCVRDRDRDREGERERERERESARERKREDKKDEEDESDTERESGWTWCSSSTLRGMCV